MNFNAVILIILRNLISKNGLCNGTLFSYNSFPESVLTPLIKLIYKKLLHFLVDGLQFPILLALAMNVNKIQEQTFDRIGLYLDELIFSHGTLYVLSKKAARKVCSVNSKEES